MLIAGVVIAQDPIPIGNRVRNITGTGTTPTFSNTGGNDSLRRKDRHEDSITIWFRFLDSTRAQVLSLWDSVMEYNRRNPRPDAYQLSFYCGQYLVREDDSM